MQLLKVISKGCIVYDKRNESLDVDFCLEALEETLDYGQPMIFNTDQGSQFTSKRFVDFLQGRGIKISMDGKGRATDNAICERFIKKSISMIIKAYLKQREGLVINWLQ